MRQVTRRLVKAAPALLGSAALVLATAGVATASPDPSTNRHATIITMDCEGTSIEAATIVHNNAATLNVITGGGVTAHMTQLWSWSDPAMTQDETFWFGVPGFDRNGHRTVDCDFTNPRFPGLYWRAVMFFSPAG